VPLELILALAAPVVALIVLTGVGQRKRGAHPMTAVVAGLLFPVTWTVWYVRDEHPYGSRPPRAVG
jgi:hypothetical protein